MQKSDPCYTCFLDILKKELIPAMGCTEPIAIAYAAAKARTVLGKTPERVRIDVSNNLIKNAKSVIVPNTNGLKGIEAAAAAGIIAGRAEKELEVISEVSSQKKEETAVYLRKADIKVYPLETEKTLDIIVTVYAQENMAKVHIADCHTQIVEIEKNNERIFSAIDGTAAHQEKAGKTPEQSAMSEEEQLNLKAIIDFAESVDLEEVIPLIKPQIEYNMAIAEEGLKGNYGANIGKTYLKNYGTQVRNRAIAKAAAGSDARMSGCELPVIIISGSGNQGITVSVPVIEYAKELGVTDEKLYRALVIADLIAIHEKSGIGRLSAYCGAVCAGCAAGCGIAYLHGGGYREMAHTLVNSLAVVSGIICDGAKASCAAKIASSVEAGILGYHMFADGQQFRAGDGIVTKGVEATIKNVARLGREGMKETDKEIVKMMLGQ